MAGELLRYSVEVELPARSALDDAKRGWDLFMGVDWATEEDDLVGHSYPKLKR